jgi:hypothetical protein
MITEQIAERFAAVPEVTAVALAGSATTGSGDVYSDYDIYVYANAPVPLKMRTALAHELGQPPFWLNNTFWETGDEWQERATGRGLDIMYRDPNWTNGELERVLVRHEAYMGYSTCIWYNIKNSQPLFDRKGWYQELQAKANVPYPPELKRAIIAKNHPILRQTPYSYVHQLEVAAARQDIVSLNHRVAALVASYFDILFAVNKQPHPGEKRLLAKSKKLCSNVPADLETDVAALLSAVVTPNSAIVERANILLDKLDALLKDE